MIKYSLLCLALIMASVHPVAAYNLSGQYLTMENVMEPFDKFQGELLLIEAFSTECVHCIDYHPTIKSLYDDYHNSLNMLSLSINADDTIEDLEQFTSEHPTPWQIGLALDQQFKTRYGVAGTPTTLLFDTQGRLASCMVGTQESETLRNEVELFLLDPANYSSSNLEHGTCSGGNGPDNMYNLVFYSLLVATVFYLIYMLWQGWNGEIDS